MSIKCMSRVWEHSKHKGSALLLLLAIADYAKDDGSGAWPSVETLAEKVRMTTRNTQLLLRKLEESGELLTENGAGPHGTNLYSVMVGEGGEKIAPLKFSVKRGEKSGKKGVKRLSPNPSVEPSINHHIKEGADAPPASEDPKDHPAVTAYREEFKRFPRKQQMEFIAASVESSAESLARWRVTLEEWSLQAWAPNNVPGMIDRYHSGANGKSSARPARKRVTPADPFGGKGDPLAGMTPAQAREHIAQLTRSA